MTEAQALRAAIKKSPGDPMPALVYADHLDDRGHHAMAAALRRQIANGPIAEVMVELGRNRTIVIQLGEDKGDKTDCIQVLGEVNEWGMATRIVHLMWPFFEKYGELLLNTQPLQLIELDDLPDLRITRSKDRSVAWRLAMRADLVEFNSELELNITRRHRDHTVAVSRQLLRQFAKPWPGVLIDITPRTEVQWRQVGYSNLPPWQWRPDEYDDIVLDSRGAMQRFEEWSLRREFDGKRWRLKNRHN